ncbi:MAG TPA: LysR family transcriptional regulator [Acidimicrobiales bacterium]|nr:LysR family transcriptional regulator [Acidimicrobiales bacterium]
MDLRRLRALQAVVDTGSVTAAADQVGYTPSAVSQHITALERETGAVLFERAGRGIRPTDAGRLLAAHARDLFSKVAEAEAAIAALQSGNIGTLRVVSFPTAGASLIPPALATVRRELPRLDVALRVAERDDSVPLLRQGEVDVVVTVEDFALGDSPGDGLAWVHLLDDRYRLVLPRNHRLAGRRLIDLAELAEDNWVETMCGVGCCHEAASKAFRNAGFEPHCAVEADEYWPAQGFVAAGLGVAIIPTLGLGVLHDSVVVRRLRRDNEPLRHVWAATRPALLGRAPVQTMLRALQQAAADHERAMRDGPRAR